jgi:hypothetical protein
MLQWPVGAAIALVGLGLALPAVTSWQEQGAMSSLAYAMLVPVGILLACGIAGVALGLGRSRRMPLPASVLGAVLINALFLGFFALETSSGLAREGGTIARSLFFFPPALLLFWGLVAGRRWAWHAARWSGLLFALAYLGISAVVCLLQPADQDGPVWIWIAAVGVVLGSFGGFHALARPSARRYFSAMP